jgi:magnesium-transporting ATPase (P-type)
MYFLVMGFIMALGWYTDLFESAIFPWTVWGPLAIVISFSLTQEGMADIRRHKSDEITNNHKCIVLRRADELDAEGGLREMSIRNGVDVKVSLDTTAHLSEADNLPPNPMLDSRSSCEIAFQLVKRKDIRQGQIVLVRNREMIPADLILLASSADKGSVYIETMSIDGEINLKLRTSPRLPEIVENEIYNSLTRGGDKFNEKEILHESLEQATNRVCRLSALGFPNGISALENPANPGNVEEEKAGDSEKSDRSIPFFGKSKEVLADIGDAVKDLAGHPLAPNTSMQIASPSNKFVAALKSEPPNASVNTFNGVLWLPPIQEAGRSVEIPLNAENILLRGAVLRNTEWAIGLVCYSGDDTKLVRNSVETPSKFSRLDQLTNSIVCYVIGFMMLCNAVLASCATYMNKKEFSQMRYVL